MEILFETKNILEAIDEGHFVAHAISGDYVMSIGLAKQINNEYEIASKLFLEYDYIAPTDYIGEALLVDNIFNLVVKPKYRHSLRSDDLICALYSLKDECESRGITDIYMPKICCGYNGMEWSVVERWLTEAFDDTEITIHILMLPNNENIEMD